MAAADVRPAVAVGLNKRVYSKTTAPAACPSNSVKHFEDAALIALAGKAAASRALRASAPGWRRMRTPEELRAHHESGHAVATWCAGRHVWKLSIVKNENARTGGSGFRGGFCLGGATPEPPGLIERSGRPETDLRQAVRACWALAVTEPPYGWRAALRIGQRLRARARELIDRHWPLVARLAAELEEHRELDHVQIARILGHREM